MEKSWWKKEKELESIQLYWEDKGDSCLNPEFEGLTITWRFYRKEIEGNVWGFHSWMVCRTIKAGDLG